MTIQYIVLGAIILLVILVSIQYTLNKILVSLKEVIQLLHLIANRTK